MGLPLYVEKDENAQSHLHENIHSSQLQERGLGQNVAMLTWVMRWYDPRTSLYETLSDCLGHGKFSYWGCLTPWRHDGSGVCKIIVGLDDPSACMGHQEVSALGKPQHPNGMFWWERCSATAFHQDSESLLRYLNETNMALLQTGSFQVGEGPLCALLGGELLLAAANMTDG